MIDPVETVARGVAPNGTNFLTTWVRQPPLDREEHARPAPALTGAGNALCRSIHDLNNPARPGLNQHRAVVHDSVAVLANTVFSRDFIVLHARSG